MNREDLPGACWRKASYSAGQGACVEIALTPSLVGIGDTKDPDGAIVAVRPDAARAFIATAAAGIFDA